MIRNLNNFIILLCIGSLFISCGINDDTIVARIDNFTIRLSELKNTLSETQMSSESIAYYNTPLNTLIENKLKLLQAYEQGIDKDNDILESVLETERRAVYQSVIEKNIIEKYIPESDLRKHYELSGEQLRVRQLYIDVPLSAPKSEILEVRKELNEARDRVLKGEDFVSIIKEYARNEYALLNNGDLGFLFYESLDVDKKLFETAYNLKEREISSPFSTDTGYAIVRVEDRKKSPMSLMKL